jgi:signal transduction histidine kinase/small ligand-binding sensory domain FIST
MKTYNFIFENCEKIDKFLQLNNDILEAKSVLIQIFSGILDKQLLQSISTHLLHKIPIAKIIGATTDGEIFNDTVDTNSIVISITLFEKSTVTTAFIDDVEIKDSSLAGERIALKLKSDTSKVFILFGDGLNINGEEFLNGVSSTVNDVVVSGGLSGDNATFSGTYLISQDKIIQNGVVGVSINSHDLIVNQNYSFAWQNIGREFLVNKAIKGRVFEIDGMTPVELYSKYLGEEAASLLPGIGIEFPLIIQNDDIDIARAVLAKYDDGSLEFAGNIQAGTKVKFGIGNIDVLLSDAKSLAHEISVNSCESMFIYSCMARRRFLGSQSSEDIKFLSKITSISGFFTYGEFFTFNDEYKLLNESMTILSLSENSYDKKSIGLEESNKSIGSVTTLRALSHLVNVTSKELENLNESLETKVASEIEKNLEYEKKVFDSMKMASLGDMIANIAHQWRQPLSVITTSASGMQVNKEMGILDDESFLKYTNTMISQSMYLSETINTFRDFIKEEHILCDIVLQDEINNTLKILDVVLKDNGIELIDMIDYDKPVMLRLITGELPQVLINIINNAKDALNENNVAKKWVKLSLETNEDRCILSIEDNGGGIPDDVLPKIFEPYFTTKSNSSGTGIGLYMSYDIVKKHFKGDIYAKNTQHGAKFFIELPIISKEDVIKV